MNRNERHAAILRLVGSQPISTQTELADALHREGHDVVQTTVSRDIHELGLIKVRHESGRLIYAFPEDTAGYSEELWIERAWRDSRLLRIGGGTDEVMREIVSRTMGVAGGRD